MNEDKLKKVRSKTDEIMQESAPGIKEGIRMAIVTRMMNWIIRIDGEVDERKFIANEENFR